MRGPHNVSRLDSDLKDSPIRVARDLRVCLASHVKGCPKDLCPATGVVDIQSIIWFGCPNETMPRPEAVEISASLQESPSFSHCMQLEEQLLIVWRQQTKPGIN